VRAFTSAQAAVAGANVMIPATAGSTGGYLQAGWLGKGWLMIAVSLDDCTLGVLLSAGNDLDRRVHDGRSAGVHLAHGFKGL
jgi:hypothetical protein